MNTVFVGLSFNPQITAFQAAALPDFELRKQTFQNTLAVLRGDGKFAVGEAVPVLGIGHLSAGAPSGIGSDAGDADQQVHVPHYFGKNCRWNFHQRNGLALNDFKATWLRRDAEEPQTSGADGAINVVARDLCAPGKVHLEFSTQVVARELEIRIVVRIPLTHQIELPATLATECRKLMLADDMCSETIRVGPGLTLGIGQKVDFAMRLLERLPDAVVLQPAAPA